MSRRWLSARTSALLCVLALLVGCGTIAPAPINQLWPTTVSPYVQDALWQPKLNYDAANALMLPLHHAFSPLGTAEQRNDFDQFFYRFATEAQINFDTNTLRYGQFSYLVSRYLVLSAKHGSWTHTHEQLRRQLLATTEFYWFYRIRYDAHFRHSFAGHNQRIRWKLKHDGAPSHVAALIDDELFTMAIASDLVSLSRFEVSASDAKAEMLSSVITQTCEIIGQAGTFNQHGGWQLQPGAWSDHNDYAYAGHQKLTEGLEPRPVTGIDQDSSHFHRFPLWLISFQSAASTDSCKELYVRARNGIVSQLQRVVWHPPDTTYTGPRLSNYFDGNNGLYRYGYKTVGEALGYGPWQLSGAIVTGWYAFVDADWIRRDYTALATHFPLDEPIKQLYIGPDTTRYRHPLVATEAYWRHGFAKLQSLIAAQLNPSDFLITRHSDD